MVDGNRGGGLYVSWRTYQGAFRRADFSWFPWRQRVSLDKDKEKKMKKKEKVESEGRAREWFEKRKVGALVIAPR